MKKTVSLLLLAALLVSLCCAACPASAEAAGPRMEDLEDQAFSLSLACWLSEFYCGQPESLVLWDALGWHAARAWRIDGQKLVSWKEASDFLRSLGGGEDMMLPEGWEEYDVVRTVIGAGSSLNYDFASHKDMFEAMIGVDTEVSMKLKNENTVQVCITRHGEGEP